jgi:hypothetical protein
MSSGMSRARGTHAPAAAAAELGSLVLDRESATAVEAHRGGVRPRDYAFGTHALHEFIYQAAS